DDKTRTLYCLRLGQMLQASTSFVPHGSTTPFDRMGIAEYFPVGYIQPTIRGPKRRVVGPRLRTSRPPVCRPLRSRRCTVICRETTLRSRPSSWWRFGTVGRGALTEGRGWRVVGRRGGGGQRPAAGGFARGAQCRYQPLRLAAPRGGGGGLDRGPAPAVLASMPSTP